MRQVRSRAEGRSWVRNPQREEELGGGVCSEQNLASEQDELRAEGDKGPNPGSLQGGRNGGSPFHRTGGVAHR